MTDPLFPIPAGLSHEPDLTRLNPDERRKHHLKALRQIRFTGSPADVRAYQARYPETAGYRARSIVTVSAPKPPGYPTAIDGMLGGWVTSDDARSQSNKADVEALNAALGGQRFDPANFLSRQKLNSAQLKKAADLFAQRGWQLPAEARTLAQVKKAAKAAAAGASPDATAFGSIGTLANCNLTIGGKAFRIVEQHGREHVRFYMDGTDARLRLDLLKEFLRQSGLLDAGGGTPTPCCLSTEVESGSGTTAAPVLPVESGSALSDQPACDNGLESLPVETGSELAAGDPLEMTPDELATALRA